MVAAAPALFIAAPSSLYSRLHSIQHTDHLHRSSSSSNSLSPQQSREHSLWTIHPVLLLAPTPVRGHNDILEFSCACMEGLLSLLPIDSSRITPATNLV